jgi:hypothetical protein
MAMKKKRIYSIYHVSFINKSIINYFLQWNIIRLSFDLQYSNDHLAIYLLTGFAPVGILPLLGNNMCSLP